MKAQGRECSPFEELDVAQVRKGSNEMSKAKAHCCLHGKEFELDHEVLRSH